MPEPGAAPVYVQELEPVADSLGLSALVAALPLLIVLILLGGVRMRAHLAGLCGLLTAVLVARLAYRMPLDQTLSSAALVAVPHTRVPAAAEVRAAVLTGARSADLDEPDPRPEVLRAYAPYALIITVFSIAQIPAVKDWLTKANQVYDWPFLDVVNPKGQPIGGNLFTWPVVSTGGTLVLFAGICAAAVLRVHARVAAAEWAATVRELRFAILTVTSVLALAYVMNLSGQAATIGHFVAAAGAGLAFLSPVLGWFGVAVSGSDTSANALFGALQVSAAHESGLSPELLAAANSSGGVLGKMISPQNLTIACAAVGLAGREGDLLRKVLPWSLGLLLVMCLIVVGQSSPVLGWMLP